jgi:hypothetical protein
MPSLIGTPVAANYSKAQPSTTFGTRELAVFVVDCDNNIENNYEDSNSRFAQVIRGLQSRLELYIVGRPSGSFVTVIASATTAPFPEGRTAGDGNRNGLLEDAVNAAADEDCYVWNAALNGNGLNYD